MPDPLVDAFWDASLGEDEVDYETFLDRGGEDMELAVELHQVLKKVGKRWRNPDQPQQLGDFQVLGLLGSGGLGRVWLGWDPELQRNVAIKVIERDHWAENEARAIAHLDHRAVVKVYEVGPDRLVMELLDGGSLQDEIEGRREGKDGHLPTLEDRLRCLLRIAEGLAYCHERGVLHRDVKPGNVLFAKDDPYPRLIDFGLAHAPGGHSLDITQNLVGSPAYISPEQVELGETGTDPRSDQFSFGVLAYELLTLQNPFVRDTRTRTLDAVRDARPPALRRFAPEVPEAVQRIVQHCLELDPRHRYAGMNEVVGDLRDAIAHRPISIGRRGVVHLAQLWYRRNRRLTQVGLAGVAAAGLLGISMWGKSVHAARNELLAEVQGIDNRISRLNGTTEFNKAGLDLFVARLRGQQFDEGRVGALLFGETRPEIDAAIESWSRRLGLVATEAEQEAPETFPVEGWKIVFQLDQGLCPGAEWNRDYRDRGRLFLSEALAGRSDLQLLKQVVRGPGKEGAYRTFREVELTDYPPVGYYRLVIPGEWEREFVQESVWDPPTRVERTPRRVAAKALQDDPSLPGLAFSEIVTIGQYREYCRAAGIEYPFPQAAPRTDDAPFWGFWVHAQAFAVWAGGRLPQAEEVGALLAAGRVELDDQRHGEYVSNTSLIKIELAGSIDYERWARKRHLPPLTWIDEISRGGTQGYRRGEVTTLSGFRVVFVR